MGTVKRSDLIKTLEVASRGLAGNNLVQAYTNFCFSDGVVCAYNYAICVSGNCEIKDKFAVHGTTLLGLLKNCQTDEISIKLTDEAVLVTSGKSKLKLTYLTDDSLLFKPPTEFDYEIELNEDFFRGLKVCLTTSSNDLTQPKFAGIGVAGPFMYSCNGDAITRYAQDVDWPDTFFSKEFCSVALKTYSDTGTQKATLLLNKEWVVFRFPNCGYSVYGRMLGSQSLDYNSELNAAIGESPKYLTIPDGFNAALSRAQILTINETVPTNLKIIDGHMHLHTETSVGVVTDGFEIEAAPIAAPIEVNIGAAAIQRCVELCTEFAVAQNCCIFRKDDGKILMVMANM